jgi:hypothetical protein
MVYLVGCFRSRHSYRAQVEEIYDCCISLFYFVVVARLKSPRERLPKDYSWFHDPALCSRICVEMVHKPNISGKLHRDITIGGFGFSILIPQSASDPNTSDPLLLSTTKVCKGYLELGSELKKKSFCLLLLVKLYFFGLLLLLVKTIFSAHHGALYGTKSGLANMVSVPLD